MLDPVRVAKRSDPVAQLAGAVHDAARRVAGATTMVDDLETLLKRVKLIGLRGVRFAVETEGIANPHLEVRDARTGLAVALARENATRPVHEQREAAVLDAIDELVDGRGQVRGADVAAHLRTTPPQIATAAQRLERRAAIRRVRGAWQIEHRLLHRYRTTGDIV